MVFDRSLMRNTLVPAMIALAALGGALDQTYSFFLLAGFLAALDSIRSRRFWAGILFLITFFVMPGVVFPLALVEPPLELLVMRSLSLLSILSIVSASAASLQSHSLGKATIRGLLCFAIVHLLLVVSTDRVLFMGNTNSELVYWPMILCAVGAWGLTPAFVSLALISLLGLYSVHAWTLCLAVLACFFGWIAVYALESNPLKGSLKDYARFFLVLICIGTAGYILVDAGVFSRVIELASIVDERLNITGHAETHPEGSVGKRIAAYHIAYEAFVMANGMPLGFGVSDQLAETHLGLGSLHNGFLALLVDAGVFALFATGILSAHLSKVLGGPRFCLFVTSAYLAQAALSNNFFGSVWLWVSIGIAYGALRSGYAVKKKAHAE